MKKLITIFLATVASIAALACWYPDPNDDNVTSIPGATPILPAIIGTNYYQSRLPEDAPVNDVDVLRPRSLLANVIETSMPITLWFRIYDDNDGGRWLDNDDILQPAIGYNNISESWLFYKVLPSSIRINSDIGSYRNEQSRHNWRLAKHFNLGDDTVTVRVETQASGKHYGMAIFGEPTITKEMIESSGDTISTGDWIVFLWVAVDNAGRVRPTIRRGYIDHWDSHNYDLRYSAISPEDIPGQIYPILEDYDLGRNEHSSVGHGRFLLFVKWNGGVTYER